MSDLVNQQCKVCEGGVSPLARDEADKYIHKLASEWTISNDSKAISREFKFKNYYETIAFVNVVALISHQQDHHPELRVGYNRCRVEYSTHSIGGLSENDFICAAKTDRSLGM